MGNTNTKLHPSTLTVTPPNSSRLVMWRTGQRYDLWWINLKIHTSEHTHIWMTPTLHTNNLYIQTVHTHTYHTTTHYMNITYLNISWKTTRTWNLNQAEQTRATLVRLDHILIKFIINLIKIIIIIIILPQEIQTWGQTWDISLEVAPRPPSHRHRHHTTTAITPPSPRHQVERPRN